jgi:hypothetical protein
MPVEDRKRSASVNDLLPLSLRRNTNLLDDLIKEDKAESESESKSYEEEQKVAKKVEEIKSLLMV